MNLLNIKEYRAGLATKKAEYKALRQRELEEALQEMRAVEHKKIISKKQRMQKLIDEKMKMTKEEKEAELKEIRGKKYVREGLIQERLEEECLDPEYEYELNGIPLLEPQKIADKFSPRKKAYCSECKQHYLVRYEQLKNPYGTVTENDLDKKRKCPICDNKLSIIF